MICPDYKMEEDEKQKLFACDGYSCGKYPLCRRLRHLTESMITPGL